MEEDWTEVKRLLKYLNGSRKLKLKVGSNEDFNQGLICFVDADLAQNVIDRKSLSGYVFKFRGGCVSWYCHKQQSVSLSSTEAEYIALGEATQEAIWLRRLLTDFGIQIETPTEIF
ncbi:uncharacterized protein LOC142239834 [Haematobia irritans]|uniref:uncharacterized protein LOC142239834 n=1 Tax=Haematobia irritans TaxID=7368 RepID=UPI003F4FAC31